MTTQTTEIQTPALHRIGPDFEPVIVDDHFMVTPQGLDVRGEPDFDQCEIFWKKLRSMERGIQFAIGDAAKYLRSRWGEKADQIISAATGWSEGTVRAYEWTAEKVPLNSRHMESLTYSHHQAVAKLPPREQAKWLNKAAGGEWSVAKMKSEMKHEDYADRSYWLTVRCKSEAERDALQKRLESEGFTTAVKGA